MQGLSISSLKRHRALIPLYAIIGTGLTGSLLFTIRSAFRNPDVAWVNKNEGQAASNESYRSKQFKFYSPNVDYTNLESQAPKY